MPKIYEYFGLMFLIYSNDHEPIHVHVKSGNSTSVIEIIRNSAGAVVEVRKRKKNGNNPLPAKELKTALKFVNLKAEEIIRMWKQIQDGKYNQKPIIITRKLF